MNIRLQDRVSRTLGVILIASGLVLNKFLLERLVSSDGQIGSPILNGCIVLGQCLLVGTGLLVYVRRPVIQLSRRSIGVLLLILFALQSVARVFLPQVGYLDSILKSGYQSNDEVTAYEARFDCIRDALPRNGVVGYTTSQTIRDDWAKFYHNYFLTQYSLAPVLVANSLKQKLLIADFPEPQPLPAGQETNGLVLIRDCGSGVALFERHSQE